MYTSRRTNARTSELDRRATSMSDALSLTAMLSKAPRGGPFDGTAILPSELARIAERRPPIDAELAVLAVRFLMFRRGLLDAKTVH